MIELSTYREETSMDYEEFEGELAGDLAGEGWARDQTLRLLAEAFTPVARALAMRILRAKLAEVREEILTWKGLPAADRIETFKGMIDRVLPKEPSDG